MFIKEYTGDLLISENVYTKYGMQDIAYFDIETTGFDKDRDKVVLISLGQYITNNSFKIIQYFAQSLAEEIDILKAFCTELSKYKTWCSYNGLAFDEPFIRRRLVRNRLNFQVPDDHVDLYRRIKPYHKQLGMERCNLKTVEKFLGVDRMDKIDGAISVQLYDEYLETKNDKLQDILMLHNYEDVLHLPKIFNILQEIDTNTQLVREDSLTEKQFKYLNSLMKQNKIILQADIKKFNKKTASRIIDSILRGETDESSLMKMVSS